MNSKTYELFSQETKDALITYKNDQKAKDAKKAAHDDKTPKKVARNASATKRKVKIHTFFPLKISFLKNGTSGQSLFPFKV